MSSAADPDASAPRHPGLRRLLDTVNAPLAALTPAGTLLLVSRPFAQMLQRTPEQLEGQPFGQLAAPREQARLHQVLERVGTTPETVRDLILRRARGEKLYVHLSLQRLGPPYPDLILLTAQDLTPHYRQAALLRQEKAGLEAQVHERTAELEAANDALRAASEALAAKQDLLERILEQAADGIVARDAAGVLIFANAAAKRRARIPPEGTPLEMAPAIWGETFDATGNPLPVEVWPVSRALRGETVTGVEWHRVLPDGTRYVVLNSAAPIRDSHGAIIGTVALSTDITERKRAEEALASQQVMLRTILEQAADGILVHDSKGKVVFANAALKRLAWLPPEGTDLDTAAEVWRTTRDAKGEELPVGDWPVLRALRGETLRGIELHRIAPDGTPYVFINSVAPVINQEGRIVGAVAINTDITERKRVEEQLRQALGDKETLLREVHHRVKNNLQMLCDLLYLQAEGQEDRGVEDALRDAYGRIFAIARLHEQLYQSMQRGRVHLGEYLGRLVSGLAELHGEVAISLDAPREAVHLDVDRAIHAGLIANELLTNAVKHGFPGGQHGDVILRVRIVDKDVELRVQDTGKGVPPGIDLEHAKTLGLRIVRILVQRLHGTIRIESQAGSVFTVRFPFARDAPAEPGSG
jgi:PAS domain S-box-containing protein